MRAVMFYCAGTAVWFLLISLAPATDEVMRLLIWNFIWLSIGLSVGFFGRTVITRYPWILIIIPLLSLVLMAF